MLKKILVVSVLLVAGMLGWRFAKTPIYHWYAIRHANRSTVTPATAHPDQLCLTWSDDPRTSQTIQWRTASAVKEGHVQYREKAASGTSVADALADHFDLDDAGVRNDPLNSRFSAVLEKLKPATAYTYRVGSTQTNDWSDWADFTTAPDGDAPFSFVYLGDPQLGFGEWKDLLQAAQRKSPSAALYTIAGDLVDDGEQRNQWDEFFAASAGIFDRHAILPSIGNHDYARRKSPSMYLKLFTLPANGPATLPKEHAYSLRYGNALFIVLDSNKPARDQADWLEEQLKSGAKWKFAVYHHPAFVSKDNRDNEEVREIWGKLFDKYHLDIALQGHDHAYLRTFPMNAGKKAASASEGTYYVISVSGTKYYDQLKQDYAEVEFPQTSTYQVIDIGVKPDRLTYRAYDVSGKVRDEVVIEK